MKLIFLIILRIIVVQHSEMVIVVQQFLLHNYKHLKVLHNYKMQKS